MQELTTRCRNRVYKALHKQLTYFGVERTVFYFVCVVAVDAFNLLNSLLAGLVVFIGGYTFGRQMAQAGVSLKVIQEAAGHKTIKMSARYAHMDHTTLQNAMSVLNRNAAA